MSVQPEGQQIRRKRMDKNMYVTKKSIGQGLLDIALIVVSSTQLKYLSSHPNHDFPNVMLGFIITAFVLKGITALLIPILIYLNINEVTHHYEAALTNHIVLGLNMLILANDTIIMGFSSGYQPYKNGTVFIP